jgi:hypothetical protein
MHIFDPHSRAASAHLAFCKALAWKQFFASNFSNFLRYAEGFQASASPRSSLDFDSGFQHC